jgi:hypothetical protein
MSPAEGTQKGRVARPKAGRPKSRPRSGLRAAEAIYLVAAILLFVLMFLTWYEIGIGRNSEPLGELSLFTSSRGQDAWQALEVIPIFLMLAIAVAIGAALLRLSRSDWKPAIPPGAAVCVLGGLAALLILIRIVSPAGPQAPELTGYELRTTVQLPAFLALAAALGIAYGGWRTMRDEGTSFAAIGKRLESPRRPAKPKSSAAAKSSTRTKS